MLDLYLHGDNINKGPAGSKTNCLHLALNLSCGQLLASTFENRVVRFMFVIEYLSEVLKFLSVSVE